MNDSTEIKMGPEGRILIPADLRRRVGLQPGAIVVVRVDGEELRLSSPAAIRRRLQEMFADVEGSMADDLLPKRQDETMAEQPS